jgi:hypothetical protein
MTSKHACTRPSGARKNAPANQAGNSLQTLPINTVTGMEEERGNEQRWHKVGATKPRRLTSKMFAAITSVSCSCKDFKRLLDVTNDRARVVRVVSLVTGDWIDDDFIFCWQIPNSTLVDQYQSIEFAELPLHSLLSLSPGRVHI